ncbi:MAG TPA: 30S ribosomal protein S5 [Candidatus Paceibacterota bacterium]
MADEQNTSDTSTGSDIELVPEKKAKKTFSFVGKEKERKGGRGRGKGERIRSEFAQSIISIRRVARVVAGGRRFSFSVALVAGDRNGKVGVGLGKAGDTSLAIDKALKHAKKHMINVPLTKSKSIDRDVLAKYASSVLYIKPAPGRGLSAGGSVRNVLDLAGVTDTNAKIISRSKNRLNNARAAIYALSKLKKINPVGK